MNGYIKLHRKIVEWGWYGDPNVMRVFIHLLLTANFRPSEWMGHVIGRGQCVIGLKKLSKITHISVQTIRTCLTRLKSTHEITIQPTRQSSIITICNYELYQCADFETNNQSTHNPPKINTPTQIINTPINTLESSVTNSTIDISAGPYSRINTPINTQPLKNQHTTPQKSTPSEEGIKKEEVLVLSGSGKYQKKSESNHYHPDARIALGFLNQFACRNFRETDANLSVISARLSEEGVQLCCVKKMIERQCRKWKGSNMEDYLRPETLFGKQKFDGYYASRDAPIIEGKPDPKPAQLDVFSKDLDAIQREYGNPNTP